MARTKMRTLATLALATALLPGTLWAQQRVEQRRAVAPDGFVEIESTSGSVRVVGWNRAEVEVGGSTGRSAEGFTITGGPRRTRIEVGHWGHPRGGRSDLEIRVPAGSSLRIECYSAAITVSDVTGSVWAESVDGSITVTSGSKEIDVETVNGAIEVTAPAKRVRAESTNGSVTVRGGSGAIEASTVNGSLTVTGGTFDSARLETVNGRIRFEGDLSPRATLDAEAVGGSVELLLPADVSADFSLSSFSGEIVNDFGPAARRTSKYTSQKELQHSTGSGGAKVVVETLSGRIALRKK
jgi:DUF4097 and DUF4098 domain-containing protein YvlB